MKDSNPYWMTLPAKPRKLTVNDLQSKGACFPQVAEFIDCFNEWVLVTSTTATVVAQKFDWYWARDNLLSPVLAEEIYDFHLERGQRLTEEGSRIFRDTTLSATDYRKALDDLQYACDVDLACIFAQAYNADTWQNRLRIRLYNFFHRR